MSDINALQQNMLMPAASASFSAEEILSALIENGMVDADGAESIMKKKQIEFVKRYHKYKIWEGEDHRWRTYIQDREDPKKRKLISRSSEEELMLLLYDRYTDAEARKKREKATLESLFEEWLESKAKYSTDSTIRRNRSTWKSLYMGEPIIRKPIVKLTTDDIEDWLLEKVGSYQMNQHQYVTFSSVIRQMLEYAVKTRIIPANPMDGVRMPRNRLRPEPKKASETQVFMPDERDVVIRYALEQYKIGRSYTQRFVPLAIAFLLSVSLRRGEVTALRFEDLNGRNLTLSRAFSHGAGEIVERLKDAEGWRNVYVVPSALEIIELVRAERKRLGLLENGDIFVIDGRYQSFYSALGKMINNYCDELCIPRRSLHSTRRTCASMMHASNISDLTIQAQLGHKDLRTTQNSYCYDLSRDDERYELISQAMA